MYALIIPARNEEVKIGSVLESLRRFPMLSIVVVDDGSEDRTSEIAQKFTQYVIRHKTNLGKGAAMKTGALFAFYYLRADAVIFMDSDGQHDPEEVGKFVRELETGSQLVLGVRKSTKNMAWYRKRMSRFSTSWVKWITGSEIPDIPCGFKGMSKSTFERIRWMSTDYGVELEIAIKIARLKISFSIVPIKTIYNRKDHEMNVLDILKVMGQLVSWSLYL